MKLEIVSSGVIHLMPVLPNKFSNTNNFDSDICSASVQISQGAGEETKSADSYTRKILEFDKIIDINVEQPRIVAEQTKN